MADLFSRAQPKPPVPTSAVSRTEAKPQSNPKNKDPRDHYCVVSGCGGWGLFGFAGRGWFCAKHQAEHFRCEG